MDDDLDTFDASAGLSLDDLGIGGEPAGDNGVEGASPPPPPSGATPEAPAAPADSTLQQPAPPVPGQQPAAAPEPWQAPPKSWKQEHAQAFATLPPAVQQYVHEREQQALQGIMHYKQQADAFNQIFEPYKELMKSAGVEPTGLVHALTQNHHVLATGSQEAKVQTAIRLFTDYNIDPRLFVAGLKQMYQARGGVPQQLSPPPPPAPPPGYDRLQRTVEAINADRIAEKRIAIQKEVDAFASANKYYSEVESDIAELIRTGAAEDLKTAYDIAIYRNPSVRAKVIQETLVQNAAQGRQLAGGKQQAAQLNLVPGVKSASTKPATMEETMQAIADKHYDPN